LELGKVCPLLKTLHFKQNWHITRITWIVVMEKDPEERKKKKSKYVRAKHFV
jgi:hypothetical protein